MFKTRFTEIPESEKRKGTIIKGDSMTVQSSAEDTEIYSMLEKYTNSGIVPKLKNENPMYIDTTVIPQNLDLKEIINLRTEMENYFRNMTALSRKRFGDSFDEFYERYKTGDWEQFKETNVFTQEQVNEMNTNRQQLIQQQKEQLKQELETKYTEIINNLNKQIGEQNAKMQME